VNRGGAGRLEAADEARNGDWGTDGSGGMCYWDKSLIRDFSGVLRLSRSGHTNARTSQSRGAFV